MWTEVNLVLLVAEINTCIPQSQKEESPLLMAKGQVVQKVEADLMLVVLEEVHQAEDAPIVQEEESCSCKLVN